MKLKIRGESAQPEPECEIGLFMHSDGEVLVAANGRTFIRLCPDGRIVRMQTSDHGAFPFRLDKMNRVIVD